MAIRYDGLAAINADHHFSQEILITGHGVRTHDVITPGPVYHRPEVDSDGYPNEYKGACGADIPEGIVIQVKFLGPALRSCKKKGCFG